MGNDNKHGYEIPKLGIPPLIHDFLYNNRSAIGEQKTSITKTPVKAYRDMWLDEKARAKLFERQYAELAQMTPRHIDIHSDMLARHESERKALKDNS